VEYELKDHRAMDNATAIKLSGKEIGYLGEIKKSELKKQDVKTPVWCADIIWDELMAATGETTTFREISKFPQVERDLAIVVDRSVSYSAIEKATAASRLPALRSIQLFDIFESDKLGAGKKSMAINYIFMDNNKTLTDAEIDAMMNKLITAYQKEFNADIRK
jgi:phenylalanyl-tRNA synthetase beta chain